MRKILVGIFIYLFITVPQYPQAPKFEFRAAWVSTVANIDWPSTPGAPPETQKQQLITILDYLKDANLNAIVFQVRPACDAMYASEIEPWSFWLTGLQGKAPSSYFDPLEFAVEEAHKRGMEIHAWFNPYRVKLSTWNLQLSDNNPAVQHPDWVLNVGGDLILDPGLPQVREHVTNVIMDVVRRYGVDGIHFDDYFFLSGISNQDANTFAQYSRGFTDLGDWRRDNVHELLRQIYSAIQTEAPHVKFGQSPRGIWRNNVPPGISGSDNYTSIYCDAVTWLNEQIIDYLAPQCYWAFDGGQDYGKLAPWWASVRNERHIYPGLAFYRVGQSGFDNTQIGRMIQLNRKTEGIYGEIHFTASDFNDNNGGVTDTLKNNYYRYKAIIPSMDWKDQNPPGSPSELRFDRVAGLGTTGITWDAPSDIDVARYALYSFDNPNVNAADIENPEYIFDVTSKNYFPIDESFPTDKKYYVVTALDHNNNESVMSNAFEFQPEIFMPSQPQLAYPAEGTQNLGDTIIIAWRYAQYANSYTVQVASDQNFTNLLVNKSNIVDTSFVVTGQLGETTYHWRVKSENIAGASDYSDTYSFTTGFPAAPALLTPAHQELDVTLNPVITWAGREDATIYQLQLFEGLSAVSTALLVDTLLTNTELQSPLLKPSTFYTWRVRVSNSLGTSVWADIYQFKTLSILPAVPQIVSPENGIGNIAYSVDLMWQSVEYANEYRLQVAYDENFTQLRFNENVAASVYTLTELTGETKYFWRVNARNNSGSSDYSEVYYFITGFPALPSAVYPLDQTLDVPIAPEIRWTGSQVADSYGFQMAEDVSMNLNKLVVDTLVTDSTLKCPVLKLSTIYTWRAKANNSVGESVWMEGVRFRTVADTTTGVEEITIPVEFAVYQNYPNPFNPSTLITFDIPEKEFTSLKIYNVLGQEIIQLINREMDPGRYSVEFNSNIIPGGLPSGLFVYVLTSGEKSIVKKMMLLK